MINFAIRLNVMAVPVTAIHVFFRRDQVVDGRNKSGHDGRVGGTGHYRSTAGQPWRPQTSLRSLRNLDCVAGHD